MAHATLETPATVWCTRGHESEVDRDLDGTPTINNQRPIEADESGVVLACTCGDTIIISADGAVL